MCKIVSLIILLQCNIDFIFNAVVTRENTDTFTPLKECAENECGNRKGYCLKSYGRCCKRCSCESGLTFFEENDNQKCITAIGHKEGNLNFVFTLNPCRANAPLLQCFPEFCYNFYTP